MASFTAEVPLQEDPPQVVYNEDQSSMAQKNLMQGKGTVSLGTFPPVAQEKWVRTGSYPVTTDKQQIKNIFEDETSGNVTSSAKVSGMNTNNKDSSNFNDIEEKEHPEAASVGADDSGWFTSHHPSGVSGVVDKTPIKALDLDIQDLETEQLFEARHSHGYTASSELKAA